MQSAKLILPNVKKLTLSALSERQCTDDFENQPYVHTKVVLNHVPSSVYYRFLKPVLLVSLSINLCVLCFFLLALLTGAFKKDHTPAIVSLKAAEKTKVEKVEEALELLIIEPAPKLESTEIAETIRQTEKIPVVAFGKTSNLVIKKKVGRKLLNSRSSKASNNHARRDTQTLDSFEL